jgi:hypothetical protein
LNVGEVKRLNVSETLELKNKHNFNLWRFDERSTTIRWPKAHHQKMVHWQVPGIGKLKYICMTQ